MKRRVRFLGSYLRAPNQVGSVTPSSRALAAKMLEPVDWATARVIVELGAGTGVVTHAIDRLRRPDSTFIVFEKDDGMRAELAAACPKAIFHDEAADLASDLAAEGIAQVDYVVSGLPFTNFPKPVRHQLLEQIHGVLAPHGQFIAFQYSRRLKSAFAATFDRVSTDWVLWNLPPAVVFHCRKRAQAATVANGTHA